MTHEEYTEERNALIALFTRGEISAESYAIQMRELRAAYNTSRDEDDIRGAGRGHLLGS